MAVKAMGADFAYMGTRFIAVEESTASVEFKEMIVESTSEDIVYTDAFSGVKGNYLIPGIKKAGIDPKNIKGKGKMNFTHGDGSKVTAWRDICPRGKV